MTEEEYQEQVGMDYPFDQQEKAFIAEKPQQKDESFLDNEDEEEENGNFKYKLLIFLIKIENVFILINRLY